MTNSCSIIDGKKIAQEIRASLKKQISDMAVKPVLVVISVGDDEASRIYVRNKEKAAAEIGMICRLLHFGSDVREKELLEVIVALNDNEGVNGIILQQPLPYPLNVVRLVEAISADKDVDGFGPVNLGLLQMNSSEAVIAATPKGVLYLIKSTRIDLAGKRAVIIGRSNIVGKPLSSLLLNQDCTVTVAHSKTVDLPALVRQADIVVAACGCAKLVKGSWVKDGAVLIDVGINRSSDGRLCGDIDFEAMADRDVWITPVPGGVGPMTVAMLLENTWQAYKKQKNIL